MSRLKSAKHYAGDSNTVSNLTRNSRNGLEFSYNLANLPENVEGTGGANLTYSYLSDGSKWRASANSGPSILYRGSFVYEDDSNSSRISSIAWDEGRISYHYAPEAVDSLVVDSGEGVVDSLEVVDVVDSLVVEDGICDEWHVRDHLGSVRAIAGIGNYITGIRELNSYLPFGTRISGSIQASDNRHRFGGKEEQRYGSFSLGLSDFGARYYDPFTCRWTTRDPLAGASCDFTPYGYCHSNPINLFDPDGNIPHVLGGAIVGAVAGATIGGMMALYQGKSGREFWGAVGGGAVEGAVDGAIFAATGGASMFAQGAKGFAKSFAKGVAIGAVSSMAGSATEQLIETETIEIETTAIAGVSGALSNGVSSVIGRGISNKAKELVNSIDNHYNSNAVQDEIRKEVKSEMSKEGRSMGPAGKKELNNRVANRTTIHSGSAKAFVNGSAYTIDKSQESAIGWGMEKLTEWTHEQISK